MFIHLDNTLYMYILVSLFSFKFIMKKLCFTIILIFLCFSAVSQNQKIDWNSAELDWLDYDSGMAEIKKTGKPGLFIIYADWCSTCKSYSKLFSNAKVVKGLSDIVLIRINRDENLELSKQFSFDGEYVPRTFALNNKGLVMKNFYDESEKYTYFIPSENVDYLIQFAKLIKLYGKS